MYLSLVYVYITKQVEKFSLKLKNFHYTILQITTYELFLCMKIPLSIQT